MPPKANVKAKALVLYMSTEWLRCQQRREWAAGDPLVFAPWNWLLWLQTLQSRLLR